LSIYQILSKTMISITYKNQLSDIFLENLNNEILRIYKNLKINFFRQSEINRHI